MIPRTMIPVLLRQAQNYPVVTITGPRQSGKTTLAKLAFPDLAYANLEDPVQREYARTDPQEFLRQHPAGMIIDEVQRLPTPPQPQRRPSGLAGQLRPHLR